MLSIVDETVGVSVEQYCQKYDLVLEAHDSVVELRDAIRSEPFKARRKALERRLKIGEIAEALECDLCSLHISRRPNGAFSNTTTYYLGGLSKAVYVFNPDSRSSSSYQATYVGPMPSWVGEKARRATKFFKADELVVASRNRAFFDIEVKPIVPASPILLGFKYDVCFLIAAWGLEHELSAEQLVSLRKDS